MGRKARKAIGEKSVVWFEDCKQKGKPAAATA